MASSPSKLSDETHSVQNLLVTRKVEEAAYGLSQSLETLTLEQKKDDLPLTSSFLPPSSSTQPLPLPFPSTVSPSASSSTLTSSSSSIPASPILPFDCLLEVCKWLAYLDSDYVEEELVSWPVTSSSPALRNLCLVSKAWSEPATKMFYRSAAFATKQQCELFLRTAEARSELPAHVRAMQIGTFKEQDSGTKKEIAEGQELTSLMLAAANKCTEAQHLSIHPLTHPNAMNAFWLIRALPLRTLAVTLFDAHSLISPEVCNTFYVVLFDFIIAHKTLKTYMHNFRPPYIPRPEQIKPARDDYRSCITSFHCTVNVPFGLYYTLPILANTLEVLSLYTEHRLDPILAPPIFSSLIHLRQLRFESNVPITDDDSQANDWLTDVLPSYEHLTRLSVTEQDCHPSLFASPPPKLDYLELINFNARPDEYFLAFSKMARDPEVTFSAKELVFVADETAFGEHVEKEEVERVVEAFERKGVKLTVMHEIGKWVEKTLVEL